MRDFCSQFVRDESGATAIEYGILASGITLAIIGAVQALSDTVENTLWEVIAATVNP
jgi:pilus assembly protein Flp/PilA